jgi:hypothetical protein
MIAPDLSSNPDNLLAFLEVVANNHRANAALYPTDFALIRRVNVCLSTVGQKLINPQPVMCAVLFQRCQYAFKTAAALALAGQVVEAFVMMRSCLEYAGYALAIFKDPALEPVFTNRHISLASGSSAKARVSASGRSVGISVLRRAKVAAMARASMSPLNPKECFRTQMS